jgi:hypothetical protein
MKIWDKKNGLFLSFAGDEWNIIGYLGALLVYAFFTLPMLLWDAKFWWEINTENFDSDFFGN